MFTSKPSLNLHETEVTKIKMNNGREIRSEENKKEHKEDEEDEEHKEDEEDEV